MVPVSSSSSRHELKMSNTQLWPLPSCGSFHRSCRQTTDLAPVNLFLCPHHLNQARPTLRVRQRTSSEKRKEAESERSAATLEIDIVIALLVKLEIELGINSQI